jgi:hypothetical protein
MERSVVGKRRPAMKIHQLSLFLENKPRHLRVPTRVLAGAEINILTLSIAEAKDFGILRLIVQDWQKAKAALEQAGCVVKVSEVVAIEVPDRPGGLDGVLAAIEEADLNIEYVYSFTARRGDRAVLVFRFEEPDKAIEALKARGVSLVTSFDDAD